jgi:hypothetical protein
MDITFSCNKCGQSIAVDEAGVGQLIDCPNCGAAIEIPYSPKLPIAPSPPPLPPSQVLRTPVTPDRLQIQNCPICSSENIIKASAAYEQGTSTVKGRTTQVGGVFYTDGGGHAHVAPMVQGGNYGGGTTDGPGATTGSTVYTEQIEFGVSYHRSTGWCPLVDWLIRIGFDGWRAEVRFGYSI